MFAFISPPFGEVSTWCLFLGKCQTGESQVFSTKHLEINVVMDSNEMAILRPKNPLLRSQWLLKKQQEGVSRARRAPPSEEQWNWLLAADRFCEEGPATYFKSIHSGQHSLQHFIKVS